LCAASSDKTVSIWDARSALCTATFYGHHNSCNAAVFNLAGTTVASTDADGE
jgi:WD40 repeat protein